MVRQSATVKARSDAAARPDKIPPPAALERACAGLESTGGSDPTPAQRPASEAHLRFLLAELELAVTYCRCAGALSSPHFKTHVIQNARNALFNVTYFVLRVDFPDHALEVISSALGSLKAALQQVSCPGENSAVEHDSLNKEATEWTIF